MEQKAYAENAPYARDLKNVVNVKNFLYRKLQVQDYVGNVV